MQSRNFCEHSLIMSTGLRPPSCIQTQDTYTPASSQSPSPNSSSQPETPFTATRVTAADRPLLVRVLNRNLVQQREEANMHSLGSNLLLNSLPAGSPLSHPNTATAHTANNNAWSPLDIQNASPDSPAERSPTTPAAVFLCKCDSPTSVLWQTTGRFRAGAAAPPPPTPASWSEPCTPIGSSIAHNEHRVHKSTSASSLAPQGIPSAILQQQMCCKAQLGASSRGDYWPS